MNLNVFQCLIMGFVSGFAELLPISAEAHRGILCQLLGVESAGALVGFFIHLACLIVLFRINREEIAHLRRTNHLMKVPPKRRRTNLDQGAVNTIRLFKTAATIVVIASIFTEPLSAIGCYPGVLAITLLINGLLLYIPSRLPSGNKNSRNMAPLDGMLMGLGAGLSVIPGISPVGASISLGVARGVDRRYAMHFAWLLLIPKLAMELLIDLIAIAGSALTMDTTAMIGIGLSAVGAGLGAILAGNLMKNIFQRLGFTGFAYYSWGAALFSLILFLMF